jgi:uncharacterized OsmC-like protein
MKVHVEKHMSTDAPRRIVRLPIKLWLPLPADHPERPLIENAAYGCPVHQSVRADIEMPMEFIWQG